MLVRSTRSGSASTIVVSTLKTGYIVAVSSSVSTSYAVESGGTATIDASAFDPGVFVSLHVMAGTFDVPAEHGILSGTFVSGNIFRGDVYAYTTQSAVLKAANSQSIILVDWSPQVFPPILTSQTTGSAPTGSTTVIPTEGQIFPRGIYAYG